jgi:hypothetical protein
MLLELIHLPIAGSWVMFSWAPTTPSSTTASRGSASRRRPERDDRAPHNGGEHMCLENLAF